MTRKYEPVRSVHSGTGLIICLVYMGGRHCTFRGRECKADNCYVMVNGIQLNNSSSAIHLGHRISSDDNECAISASVAQFWKAFNILRTDFGTLYPYLQCKLLCNL